MWVLLYIFDLWFGSYFSEITFLAGRLVDVQAGSFYANKNFPCKKELFLKMLHNIWTHMNKKYSTVNVKKMNQTML